MTDYRDKILSKDAMKAIKEDIAKMTDTLAQLEERHTEAREEKKVVMDSISKLKSEIDKLELCGADLDKKIIEIASEYNPMNSKLIEKDKALSTAEKALDISNYYDEQPSFFDVLEQKLKAKIEAYTGLSGDLFKVFTVDETISKIQGVLSRPRAQGFYHFDKEQNDLKQVIGFYERALWDTCQKKVLGQNISLNDSTRHLDIVERFLEGEGKQYWICND